MVPNDYAIMTTVSQSLLSKNFIEVYPHIFQIILLRDK